MHFYRKFLICSIIIIARIETARQNATKLRIHCDSHTASIPNNIKMKIDLINL